VQADLSDILSLASLATPSDGWDCYTSLPATPDVLGRELRAISSRALRPALLESGALPKREVTDHFYDFDDAQGAAYQELRQMRVDYVERGEHDTAWAFVALEQTFLSSMQAFRAAACRIVGEHEQGIRGDLFGHEQRDDSFDFFQDSSYFRRRLRSVQERVASRSAPNANIGAKEAALLEILSSSAGQRVVVFTSYRATQERLAGVLARARFGARIERLDARSSLRERVRILERFITATTDRWSSDGPTGVLLCTDTAAVGLSLQRACAIAVNYDLPWNPQRIEQRIGRLQRWGQQSQVKVFNLAGRNPAAEGWTMDNRVLFACRRLFNMADPTAVANDALREIAPGQLELQLAGDDELSLLADPEPEAIAALNELLAGPPEANRQGVAEQAARNDEQYREQITDFWARVSYGGSTLEGARGYLFGRLQLALLQGAVGVLCAPGRKVDDCFTFHLAVGLRLLFESAVLEPRQEPLDDQWMVEEEQVHLWAVAPDGALVDWAEFLMGGGLMEVPQDKAAKLVGRDVLDYLVAEKTALETRELDAVELSKWRRRAPSSVDEKLAVVQRHAQAMAKARLHELSTQWQVAKTERLERLSARRAFAVAQAAPDADIEAIDVLINATKHKQVRLRREILGTQLFVVTH